jgi:hypothetical protein
VGLDNLLVNYKDLYITFTIHSMLLLIFYLYLHFHDNKL